MALTPISNGDSGSSARTKINNAFTAVDLKAPIADPTFTGVVSGQFAGSMEGSFVGNKGDASNTLVSINSDGQGTLVIGDDDRRTTFLKALSGSSVDVRVPNTAGTLISTGDTGTVTDTMLAGSITPSKITGTAAILGANTFTGLQQFTGTTHAGLRLNNLTKAERDAIASPKAGMAIWNTTAARLQLHNGSAWTAGMVHLDGDTMTGALTIGVGTLATTGLRLTQTWSGGAGTTHRGMDVAVTATAGQFAAASSLFRVLGGAAGASDRLTMTENLLTVTSADSLGKVLELVSQYGTTPFHVSGGGTLTINNSLTIVASSGELRATLVGNGNSFCGIGFEQTPNVAYIRPFGSTTLQVGLSAASPVAHLLRGASSRAGTDTNVAGASLTIAGGNGTGTGGGGSLIFQTSPTGSTGSAANTLTTRMTIDNAGAIAFPNTTAVTTETVVSDRTWPVTINGVAYKICLKV